MRRRDVLALIGAAAAGWPIAATAQERKLWQVGFLAGGARPAELSGSLYGAFLLGMQDFGYVERRDYVMHWRFAEGRDELLNGLAAELVDARMDVIVAGATAAVVPLKRLTNNIPIVMGTAIDPVGLGFVANLARPGGNVTGLANSQDDTAGKQFEFLARAAPGVSRIGCLMNPRNPGHPAFLEVLRRAATAVKRELVTASVANGDQFGEAFNILSNAHAGALLVPGDPLFLSFRQRIAEFALQNRMATISGRREYVEAGGLLSYGERLADLYRRVAYYVDKLFRGAKPADLPVQQPTKYYLTINMKTAKMLGLTIPIELLAFADDVIE